MQERTRLDAAAEFAELVAGAQPGSAALRQAKQSFLRSLGYRVKSKESDLDSKFILFYFLSGGGRTYRHAWFCVLGILLATCRPRKRRDEPGAPGAAGCSGGAHGGDRARSGGGSDHFSVVSRRTSSAQPEASPWLELSLVAPRTMWIDAGRSLSRLQIGSCREWRDKLRSS